MENAAKIGRIFRYTNLFIGKYNNYGCPKIH
jgi:hypothetical protein